MALKGAAKAAYHVVYQRQHRARARASRDFFRNQIDQQVLALAKAGYCDREISDLLDLTDRALTASLGRVAEYLAPTLPCPRLVVDPADCLPFVDERYSA